MWHKFTSYCKYRFRSKTKYRIHSPFVYHLVTEVLESKNLPEYARQLNQYRKDLSQDKSLIEVTDFGAGSKVFKSLKRPVYAIAKYAGINKIKSNYLQKLVHYFKPKNILELGTSLGIGSAAMAIVAPESKIITLEGCPQTAQKAQYYLNKNRFNTIELVIGEFSETLPHILKENSFDLIYFDGNHTKQATLDYFEQCLTSLHNNSFCIFDDIHWSKDMEEAWKIIKNHPKTTVTVDLYHIGLVFFRKEQAPQDFIIKI